VNRSGGIALRCLVLAIAIGRPGAASEPTACAQPSDAEIFGALFSIYYWTAPGDLSRRDPPWKLVSPEEAVNTLRCDRSRGASSRRRRAIGRIGVALKATQPETSRISPLEKTVFGAALARLGAPPGLVDRLDQVGGDPRRILEATDDFLNQHKSADPALSYDRVCCACLQGCRVHKPANAEDVAGVEFQVDLLNAPIAAVEKTIDPQQWSACDAYFEKSSFVAEPCPPAPAQCQQPDPVASSPAPMPGTDWPTGLVFEHVNLGGTGSWVKNLLSIQASHAPGGGAQPYVVQYGLCHSRDIQLDGGPVSCPALAEDCGFISAFAKGTSSGVNGMKAIRFKPYQGNPISNGVDLALEAMVGEVVGVALCCDSGAATDCESTCLQDCFPEKPQEPIDLKGGTLCK